MNHYSTVVPQQSLDGDCAIEIGKRFLQALFAESDTILFRPIETWTEGKRKQSRTIYKRTLYRQAMPSVLSLTLEELERTSEEENANI